MRPGGAGTSLLSLRKDVELSHRLATAAGSEADIEAIVRDGDGDRETSLVIEGKSIVLT